MGSRYRPQVGSPALSSNSTRRQASRTAAWSLGEGLRLPVGPPPLGCRSGRARTVSGRGTGACRLRPPTVLSRPKEAACSEGGAAALTDDRLTSPVVYDGPWASPLVCDEVAPKLAEATSCYPMLIDSQRWAVSKLCRSRARPPVLSRLTGSNLPHATVKVGRERALSSDTFATRFAEERQDSALSNAPAPNRSL